MGVTNTGCMCGNHFLDLATLLKREDFNVKCAGVCVLYSMCMSVYYLCVSVCVCGPVLLMLWGHNVFTHIVGTCLPFGDKMNIIYVP